MFGDEMRHVKALFFALVLSALTACGGGGGSPGTVVGGTTPPASSGTTTATVTAGTVTLQLVDSTNAATTTIGNATPVFARAVLRSSSGSAVAGQVVTFTSASGLVRFVPSEGTALSDANGVATVQVFPAVSTSAGAGTLLANATIAGVAAAAGSAGFVVPAGSSSGPTLSLGLRNSSNASTNLIDRSTATSARAVVLSATGAPIAGALVTFTGNASSISFSPASGAVLTDPSGVAMIGVAAASASASGAGVLNAAVTIAGTVISDSFNYQLASSTSAGVPTLAVSLLNAANISSNFVDASGITTARATLVDAGGAPVAGRIVSFVADPGLLKLTPASGQVLTNSAGVAALQLAPASLFAAGAGSLRTSASVGGVTVTNVFDFQLNAANVALQSLDVGAGPIAAFGSRPISVIATINGNPAINTPVQVAFSVSCGLISPATITTDSSGKAVVTYSANNANCSGTNVSVSASTVGATPLSGSLAVQPSLATNVQFISTSPQLIYLKDSVGTTQAQVVFKAVDSLGNPLQNKKLRLALSNVSTGVSLDVLGNTSPVDLTTDGSGQVSVAVFSGTVPTSLNVKATLLDNSNQPTTLVSNSNLLTVASGRPTQSALSLSLGAFSIEGLLIDGVSNTVTFSMADRQGNPVPPGTQVNFVAESGVLLPAVCFVPPVIPASASSPAIPVSSCSVKFSSSGTRTANGRVSIFAYTAGEEDFVDANGNNIYDGGEPFTDLGRAFRDDNGRATSGANGIYDSGEFQVPRVSAPPCVAGVGCSGDGVWGAADVRRQATLVLASGEAFMQAVFKAPVMILPAVPPVSPSTTITSASFATPGLDLTIRDFNGNSVPTGSKIDISVIDNTPNDPITARGNSAGGTCSLSSQGSTVVPSTINPLVLSVVLKTCTSGDSVNVVVTTPLGFVTSQVFILP